MNPNLDESPSEAAAAPLHLPSGVNYTCHQSGLCCPVFPRIPVDEVSAERLRGLDYSRLSAGGCGVKSFDEAVTREGDHGETVLRRRPDDGNCVFYGEDKLCSVHKAFGEPAKPQICRNFPYRYRSTPSGVYVGLSFVCPSVRGNKGQPVVEQEAELSQAYLRAGRRESTQAVVQLTRKLEISWEQYLALESGFYDVLARRDLPLKQRLIALRVLVEFVDIAHQQAHGAYEPMAPPRSAGSEVQETVEGLRRMAFEPVFRAARRPAASPLLQRMFLGMITSFGNTMWETRGRAGMLLGLVGQYARHSTGVGRVELQPLKLKPSHRLLAGARFPYSGPELELLERYLTHCIFRKDLPMAPTVVRGLNLFLINAALLRWYAVGTAAEAGRPSPAEEDFSDAIRYVETYYGLQSKFYRTLSEQIVFEEILESFTERKNFPFIVLGEPE